MSPAKKARSEVAEQSDSSSSAEATEDELDNDEEFSLSTAPAATSLQQKSIVHHPDVIKDLQQRFEFRKYIYVSQAEPMKRRLRDMIIA